MTDIRTLDLDDGLDSARVELKYSRRRLQKRDVTRPYVAAFDALLARWPASRDGQLAHWDAEDDADVDVADVDDDLDDAMRDLDLALLTRVVSRDHPQYKHYFGDDTVNAVQRLGLEAQIARVEGWPESLRAIGGTVEAAGVRIAAIVTAGRAALTARVRAAQARADYRAREMQTFVDDMNALRRSTFGALVAYAALNSLPASWPNRFFRRGRPRRRRTSEG